MPAGEARGNAPPGRRRRARGQDGPDRTEAGRRSFCRQSSRARRSSRARKSSRARRSSRVRRSSRARRSYRAAWEYTPIAWTPIENQKLRALNTSNNIEDVEEWINSLREMELKDSNYHEQNRKGNITVFVSAQEKLKILQARGEKRKAQIQESIAAEQLEAQVNLRKEKAANELHDTHVARTGWFQHTRHENRGKYKYANYFKLQAGIFQADFGFSIEISDGRVFLKGVDIDIRNAVTNILNKEPVDPTFTTFTKFSPSTATVENQTSLRAAPDQESRSIESLEKGTQVYTFKTIWESSEWTVVQRTKPSAQSNVAGWVMTANLNPDQVGQ